MKEQRACPIFDEFSSLIFIKLLNVINLLVTKVMRNFNKRFFAVLFFVSNKVIIAMSLFGNKVHENLVSAA